MSFGTQVEHGVSPAPATRTTVAVLGLFAAFTGVEHGLGEITQGPARPPGVVFESWPHVDALDPLAGEPAMSLVPHLLATGVLAVVVATALGVWSVRYAHRRHGGTVLVGLSVLLLLVGGGFGPPLVGVLAGLLAGRITAHPARQPRRLTWWVANLWPWPLLAAVGCFLGLVPGMILLAAVVGLDSPSLVAALTAGAFLGTALAMWAARAHDLTSSPGPPHDAPRRPRAPSEISTGHRLFRIWAGVWGVAVTLLFVAVTILTVSLWLTDPAYADTTPDADLGFLALGAIIGVGLLSQLRRSPPPVGLQQALIATITLAVAGLLGQRAEPLIGALAILAILAVQAGLHPARRSLWHVGGSLDPALAVLALTAAAPAVWHAAGLLGLAREAGPSCFLGQCVEGDRPAELAAALLAVPLIGMLAALRTPGRRVPLWTTGVAALTLGSAALVLPETTTSIGPATGLAAVAWAVVFVWVGERGHGHGHRRAARSHRYDGAGPHRHWPADVRL